MGKQSIWFKTNLAFLKTKDLLIEKKGDQISGDMRDSRGRLHFRLRGFKDVTFQITTTGKLGIYFPEGVSYQDFLELVKPLLVRADGTPIDELEIIKEPSKSKRDITLEQKLEKAIENLRFTLMRTPTILEIAYRIGKAPEAIRESAFKLSPKTGWKEPSKKQISNADSMIKEIYEVASLLGRFEADIVLKRPMFRLAGQSWTRIRRRVDYARKYERGKLPKIVITKEDEQQIEFEFVWPKDSRWFGFKEYPEYYDKKKKKLGGEMSVPIRDTKKLVDKFLRDLKKPTKS